MGPLPLSGVWPPLCFSTPRQPGLILKCCQSESSAPLLWLAKNLPTLPPSSPITDAPVGSRGKGEASGATYLPTAPATPLPTRPWPSAPAPRPWRAKVLTVRPVPHFFSEGGVKPTLQAALKLRKFHPTAAEPSCVPINELPQPSPPITAEMIDTALRKFPPDTAAGNTGLRVQHLLAACTPADRTTVLDQLAALANVLARGDAPREIAPASLVPR